MATVVVVYYIQYVTLNRKQYHLIDSCIRKFFQPTLKQTSTHMSSACFIVQPFYRRSAEKGQSKQHCVCIKEKQNNSSQSFVVGVVGEVGVVVS